MTKFLQQEKASKGFTLIETVVAVALFAVVMLMSISALLALIDANRKARSLQSVVNNLNVALDGMVRAMRMGHTYNCGRFNPITQGARSCSDGEDFMTFITHEGDFMLYQYVQVNGVGRIQVRKNLETLALLTAPEVDITEMKFYIVGTDQDDGVQPKVVMVLKGTAGSDRLKTQSTFSIQSTAVQRILDL